MQYRLIWPDIVDMATMGQYGPIWLNIGDYCQYGPIWLNIVEHSQYGPIWSNMAQCGLITRIMANIAQYGQYGPIWPNMDQYGPFWPKIAQYDPIWPNIAQYCPITSFATGGAALRPATVSAVRQRAQGPKPRRLDTYNLQAPKYSKWSF